MEFAPHEVQGGGFGNEQSSGHLRKLFSKSMLALTLVTAPMIIEEAINPDQVDAVVADTYPDGSMPCVAPGEFYGEVSGDTNGWCQDYSWGVLKTGVENSPRGYAYRNCTDWAAWRVKEITGVNVPTGLRNANQWDEKAKEKGYEVDTLPEVGDVAVWNSGYYGHVEVVESVNEDGTVNTSGYNKKGTGVHGTQTRVKADAYIDFDEPEAADDSDDEESNEYSFGPDFDIALHPNGSFQAIEADGALTSIGQTSPGSGWSVMLAPTGNMAGRKHTLDFEFNANGVPVVYGLDANGVLKHTWYVTGQGWVEPWVEIPAGGGYEDFDIALHPNGAFQAMLIDDDGSLVSYGQQTPGSGWTSMPAPSGGVIAEGYTLDFEFNANGVPVVYGLDESGSLQHTWYTAGGWKSWVGIPAGSGHQDVDVALHPNGAFQAMLVNSGGGLSSYGQTSPGSSWVPMSAPSGNLTGTEHTLDFEFNKDGVPVVYGLDANSMLLHTWYSAGSGWINPWVKV